MVPPPPPPASPLPGPHSGRAVLDPASLELAITTLQQRIDQLHENLAQQNKLATLGMVTAVIAHEFNNILTPMISYTRFALSDKADQELRTKALTKALAGAERLENISKSLLGFARGDETTTANVAAAVRDTLTCLSRDLAKDGISLTVEVPGALTVAMNAGRLQQVLMNLIVNARSAMLNRAAGAGGVKRLTIRAAASKGRMAEICVTDTGPGIPAAVLPRIFEPFFSTKRGEGAGGEAGAPRGGTGLGLTISQELITAAGGTIKVMSQEGQGATFVIELPVASGK